MAKAPDITQPIIYAIDGGAHPKLWGVILNGYDYGRGGATFRTYEDAYAFAFSKPLVKFHTEPVEQIIDTRSDRDKLSDTIRYLPAGQAAAFESALGEVKDAEYKRGWVAGAAAMAEAFGVPVLHV